MLIDRHPTAVNERPAPPMHGSSDSRRLLVIDDEPTIRRAIQRCLPHHSIAFAETGEKALELAQSNDFALILCDLSLPDMSGVEVYDRIKRDKPWLAARMIVITGGANNSRAQHFISSGQVAVLNKPFAPAQLRAAVAAQLKALASP